MTSLNTLLVALTLFSTSISQTSGGPYQSFQDYINDIPYCVNNCLADTWSYAEAACPINNMTCLCLIPEPDLSDPILAKRFGQIENCTVACPAADQQKFLDADAKFNESCQPYYAKYGGPSSASVSYYLSILSTATASATYPGPSGVTTTQTEVNNATITGIATANTGTAAPYTGNLTVAAATSSAGTPTPTVAVETSNVGVWKSAEWGMSIGLPLLVSFALGVGAQFF